MKEFNDVGCYKLLEAVIHRAFEDSQDRYKAKEVLEWAESEMGKRIFSTWASLSGYDDERVRNILINKCEIGRAHV